MLRIEDLKLFFSDSGNKWKILPLLFIADLVLTAMFVVMGPILYPENVYLDDFLFRPILVLDNFVKYVYPFLINIMIAAAIEELLFRSPITFFVKYNLSSRQIYRAVLGLSFVFALFHFQYFDEVDFVLGLPRFMMGGIIFSYVYWLCGGKEGKFWKPLLFSFSYHLLFNLLTSAFIYDPSFFEV